MGTPELSRQHIELKAKGIRIWRGRTMRLFDTTGCDRIFIFNGSIPGDQSNRNRIQFQFDRESLTYSLDKETFWAEDNGNLPTKPQQITRIGQKGAIIISRIYKNWHLN